jgi:OmpA-OmpF porin, OOP family
MNTTNTSNGWRWLGLIILLLILLALWLMGYDPGSQAGCCGIPLVEQTPVAPPPVASVKSAVNIDFKAESGKITLTGEVPTVAERQNLVEAAKQNFGADNVIDRLTVNANASLPSWWANLNQGLTWLKGGNFGLGQLDKVITLTGLVASDAIKATKEADVRSLVGGDTQINNLITVEQPPAAAVTQDVPACSNDMQVAVNFATNSAKLTAEGKARLSKVMQCLKSPTEVSGHTDDVGNDAFNQKLSEARANAVIAYIKSVDASKGAMLTAVGYGESKPIADNVTEQGRAQNRRIEFIAK